MCGGYLDVYIEKAVCNKNASMTWGGIFLYLINITNKLSTPSD